MMKILKLGSRGEEVKALQRRLNLMADGIFGPLTKEGVVNFQFSQGLEADGIAGPKTLAALEFVSPNPRRINKIILHCTATPEGEDYTVDQIRAIHLRRGFSDIGYHYLIGRDGTVYPGRPEAVSGAHTAGQNAHSIGVSYVGGCPPRTVPRWKKKGKDTRTPAQKKALRELVAALQKKYPGASVHGHYEFANKACPSFRICDL